MKLLKSIIAIILWIVLFTPVFSQKLPYSWDNLPQVDLPQFKSDTFNIIKYGALADGLTLNTEIINRAINDCSKKGGGVVLIPAGLWITGPVILRSNVNLHLSRSALLQFSADKNQYQLVEGNFEGHRSIRNQSPISGNELTDIAITGEGIIDGHGEVWRAMGKDGVTESVWKQLITTGVLSADGKTWYPSESYAKGARNSRGNTLINDKGNINAMKDFFRPNMLVLTNCKRVLLQNVTFQNSPAWCLHSLLCEQVTFDGVRVRNLPNAQNGDGMDIESCSYVKVQNCTLDCGDDGICIKSGKDEEGRNLGKPTQFVVVQNNVVYDAHGGFVIGSEMSGGVHDIFVSDCTFIGPDNGLRFKTARGRGGIVENIFFRNIYMRNIGHDAILFDMYYFAKVPNLAQTNGKVDIPSVNEGTPQFRKFYIQNLVCDGADRAILIRGLPEMSIKDIFLENVTIRSRRGADIIEAKNINLKGVVFDCDDTKPLFNIENSQEVMISQLQSIRPVELLLSISGDRCKQIIVKDSEKAEAKNRVNYNYGADHSVLSFVK